MTTYLTPGVYFESLDQTRAGITTIRTDIAAFIGLAERGPLHQPTPIESWRQFQTRFGGFVPFAYLAYAVKGFFENGGARCYIVRVAAEDAATATADMLGLDGLATWRFRAANAGRWGNQLQVRISPGVSVETQSETVPVSDGSSTRVGNFIGFETGSLVRLFQVNASGTMEAFHVVEKVNPIFRQLTWRNPIKIAPGFPGDTFFDVSLPIDLETVNFSLSIYENRRLKHIYEDVTTVPEHGRYIVDIVADDPYALISVEDLHAGVNVPQWANWLPDLATETTVFQAGKLTLQCGTDGLTNLLATDFSGDQSQTERRGLRTLELVSEVALVAIPDIMIQPAPPILFDPLPLPEPDPCIDPPADPLPQPLPPGVCPDVVEQPPQFSAGQIFMVYQALVNHCQTEADRFAILDPLPDEKSTSFDPSQVLQWRQQFVSSYGGLFYPWLLVADPLQLGGQTVRPIPPSGHVAGLIANRDLTQGVHYAPANQVVNWLQGMTVLIDDGWHGILNPAQVNVIRALAGRGLRLYGARTLSDDSQLRFINVRRTLMFIEKSLEISLQWTVFEPNDYYLRQAITLSISSFLHGLWQLGMLVGNGPEQAFFVRCDDENNPPDEAALGRLHIDIGVAIVHPAEFVIVRVGRTNDELAMTELNGSIT